MDLLRPHGVLMTLVIGHLIAQVYGYGGDGVLFGPSEAALPQIWPATTTRLAWPPVLTVGDAGLEAWANRLLAKPAQ